MKVFDHPFTAMISDSSGLGKTSFVSKILKKKAYGDIKFHGNRESWSHFD